MMRPLVIASLLFTLAVFHAQSVRSQEKAALTDCEDCLLPSESADEPADRCPGETAADRDPEEPSEPDDRCPGETPVDRKPGEPQPLPLDGPATPIRDTLPLRVPEKPSVSVRITDAPPPVPPAATIEPVLSPEMLRLKAKVRATLAWYYENPEKVNDRSPWGIMHWMLPYGVDSQIIDANGQRQNAVGYLCYNYPCRGQRLFHTENGRIAAYIGPGLQGHRGQFLAMLAQSKVDPSYPMRVDGRDFKVADLIEYEKRTCEANTELTFKLIALSHYLKHDEKWTNTRGEEWDLPRLIREELKQPIVGAACGGTHRMTGFSYAVRKHQARNLFMDGQWQRASTYIDDMHAYAFKIQNRDGSFSTNWFAGRGDLADPQRRLQTSGHILEWLVYSLPKEELHDPRVTLGVDYVATLLGEGRATRWEIGPLGHALHALAIYDERVFGGQPGKRAQQLARKPDAPARQ
jgi:hypothetical protein